MMRADPTGNVIPLFRRVVVTKRRIYELEPNQTGRPAVDVFGLEWLNASTLWTPRFTTCRTGGGLSPGPNRPMRHNARHFRKLWRGECHPFDAVYLSAGSFLALLLASMILVETAALAVTIPAVRAPLPCWRRLAG